MGGLSQTFGKSTQDLSEAEKLAGSGGKNHAIISRGTDFRAKKKKKRYFIIYADINIYAIFSLNLFFMYIDKRKSVQCL